MPSAAVPARHHRNRRQALLRFGRLTHRWLGVGLGAVLIFITLTGALLVVQRELEHAVDGDAIRVEPRGAALPFTPLADRIQAAAPDGLHLATLAPDRDPQRAWKALLLNPAEPRDRRLATIDPYSGRIISLRPESSVLQLRLRELHYELGSGRPGIVVAALAAVGLLGLTLTGLWMYGGAWKNLWRPTLRLRQGGIPAWSDLHRWTGLAGLILLLGWSATAVYFMTDRVPAKFLAKPAPVLLPRWDRTQSPDLDGLVRQALTLSPGAELRTISLSDQPGKPIRLALLQRTAPVWAKFPFVYFDSRSGAVTRFDDPRQDGFGKRLKNLGKPLHFGLYGATWVKWTYFAGALAPLVLSVTGFVLWWRRRPAGPSR